MKKSLLVIVFVFLIFSCDNYVDPSTKIDNYIPENSSVVVKINNISKFKNSIINNEYLNKLSNAKEYLIDAISVLEKAEFKDQVIICFYKSDETVFNIIGNPKNSDSLTNFFIINEKDFSVISNNPNVKGNNKKNENFSLKFKNLDQTNTNFSISFNSNISGDLINVFFNKTQALKKGNLYLNVETTNNAIFLNGVVDDNFEILDPSLNKSYIDEIVNSDINFYFDPTQNLIDEYDLINSNIENPINLFQFFDFNNDLEKFKLFQLKNSDKISSINGIISDFKDDLKNSKDNFEYETKFKNNITTGPIFVKNHINKKSELIVQDENNILYLINSSGQIEWSKKIEGQVLNDIHQIDSYKNGRLQYLFATKNKLYLIDRKARNVGKFPLKFNDIITQPISVFDYDKNKNYRILITQNNELFMFDSKGNRVRGFNYIKNDKILNSPKHFRISNKDLIVFKTKNDLKIINRRGRPRIKAKTKLDFSSQKVFQYGNAIITQTNKNEIIEVDLKGNVKIIDTYSSDMNLYSIENFMVVKNGNSLFSDKNKSELKFGKYNNLKIYNSKEFTLISVFDYQNKEGYLFDQNLKLIEGFPFKSESSIDYRLNKNYFEFALKTKNKSIKFYKESI